MPHGPAATAQTAETVRRMVCMRLHPGDAATDIRPAARAGADRHVWNSMPPVRERRHGLWRAYNIGPGRRGSRSLRTGGVRSCATLPRGRGPGPSVGLWARQPEVPGRRRPAVPQALRTGGKPRFKAQPCTGPRFTIPDKVRIRDGRRYGPKAGWRRPEGSAPYAGCGGAFASGWKVRSRTPSGRPMSAMQCRRTR